MKESMEKCEFLNKLTQSLESLTYPEHRFKYCIDAIKEGLFQNASQEYLAYLSEEMYKVLIEVPDSGVYNKKFVKD